MPIPNFQSFMLPVLRSLADSAPRKISDVAMSAADALSIPVEERTQTIASGKATIVRSRAGWAIAFLKQADLVRTAARGVYRITDRGLSVLGRNLPAIDVATLEEFEEFRAFQKRSQSSDDADEEELARSTADLSRSPEEALEHSYRELREKLVSEVLDMLRGVSPARFEAIVVDLLQALGYGGGRVGAAKAIGRSGDGGIDGVIEEDRLGLDNVYVQAKRWEANVGRPIVQAFAGALQGQRANKGVLITTSDYTSDARQYAANLSTRIVLINGLRLAELMIDHDVGVSTERSFAIKRVDGDYFEEQL
jgi:restriction system protein